MKPFESSTNTSFETEQRRPWTAPVMKVAHLPDVTRSGNINASLDLFTNADS